MKEKRLMKRLSLLFISFIALGILSYAIFVPSTVLGVTTVTIRGNLNTVVPGPRLVPVANRQVSVLCGGVTKTATTDSNGLYTVTFTEEGCSAFSPVSSQSSYNNSLITRQVTVSSENRATINLYF